MCAHITKRDDCRMRLILTWLICWNGEHHENDDQLSENNEDHYILGADAAGEIAQLGEGVTDLQIGKRVILAPGYPQKKEETKIRPTLFAPSFALPGLHISGTYTQYMEVPSYTVVRDETGLKPEEVATLPVVLATAVHSVKEIGQVKRGDKVLIHSGASGSGSMLIQVAKALGAEVAATVRDDNKAEFAKKIGADMVVNTRKEDFVQQIKDWTGGPGADVVIDNLSGDILAKSIETAKPQGVIVAYGFAAGPQVSFDIRQLFFTEKKLLGSMASDIEDLQYGLQLIKERRVRPVLAQTLPLSRAAEAHRLLAVGKVMGNIVLLPWAE